MGCDADNHLVIRKAEWCIDDRALTDVMYVDVDVVISCQVLIFHLISLPLWHM